MVLKDGGHANGPKFFSVSASCSIGGSPFRPGVCYRLTDSLQDTVQKMVKKALASVYEEEMRFVSGIPRPVKKAEAVQGTPAVKERSSGKAKRQTAKSEREFL